MKAVVLHIHDDSALSGRLQVALDLCRAHDAHLTCLYVTPFGAYVAFDPLGGIMTQQTLIDEASRQEADLRARITAHMAKEDVRWDWAASDGDVAGTLAAWSALADCVIVSQITRETGRDGPLPIVDDLVLHAGCPVLAVPQGVSSFVFDAPVLVAWNRSAEAAKAIRQAVPMLARARSVEIVSITRDDEVPVFGEVAAYLDRHGISAECTSLPSQGRPAAEVLMERAKETGAGLIVMGAYGRSRLRETLLGGVTRSLVSRSQVPLLLGR